jgi:NADH dehydrogenase [ubiquinone] 1 alpha subcomplex assembly factor 1
LRRFSGRFCRELSGIDRIRLRVRGDGRRYQFSLRLRDGPPGVSWRAAVDTDGSWQTVNLPLGNLVAVVRGRPVAGPASIVSGTVCRLGFLLADRQPGRFGLEITAIEFQLEVNAS